MLAAQRADAGVYPAVVFSLARLALGARALVTAVVAFAHGWSDRAAYKGKFLDAHADVFMESARLHARWTGCGATT